MTADELAAIRARDAAAPRKNVRAQVGPRYAQLILDRRTLLAEVDRLMGTVAAMTTTGAGIPPSSEALKKAYDHVQRTVVRAERARIRAAVEAHVLVAADSWFDKATMTQLVPLAAVLAILDGER